MTGDILTQDKRLKKGEEYRVYSYRVAGTNEIILAGQMFKQMRQLLLRIVLN
jgi:hypothetical protein